MSLQAGAQVIWSEDFNSYSDGTTVGDNNNTANPANDWTLSCSGCGGTFSKQTFWLFGTYEVFQASNIDNAGTWTSEEIDISGTGLAVLDFTFLAISNSDGDYLRAYYYLDGGSRQLFYDLNGDEETLDIPTSIILQGNSVVIEIEMYNDDSGFFSTDYYMLDDITVTAITNLYSRQTGNLATTGTWSADSYGGANCGCTPTSNSVINIGNGHTVTMNSDATVAGVNVENGVLSLSGAVDLTLNYGSTLTVESGSSLNGTNSGSWIIMNANSPYIFDVDGSLQVGNTEAENDQTLDLTGSGSMTLVNDLILSDGALVTNDLASLSIGNELEFSSSSSYASFTNNGTADTGGNLYFNNDNSSLSNNGSLTIGGNIYVGASSDDNNSITNNGTLNISAINTNDGTFVITNNNLLNQTGSFSNITGSSNFVNAANGIWNYSGSSSDNNMSGVLNATATDNAFNYTRAGNQEVISTTYFILNIDGSGTKSLEGDITITDDLAIQGAAVLNANSNDIALAGDWNNTSSAGDSFLQGSGSELVTFNGSGTQQINDPETFNNLTVDKSGGFLDLYANIRLDGTLRLNNRKLRLRSSSLTVSISGDIATASSSSYIINNANGILIQESIGGGGRTGDVFFPLGRNNGSYNPLWINNDSGTADEFSVRVGNNVFAEGGFEAGTMVGSFVVNKTWFISEGTPGGSDATLTFQWDSSNEIGGFDRANMGVSHFNGAAWEPLTAGDGAGGGGPYSASVSNVSDFSPFALGSDSSPLPIELVEFKASYESGRVNLSWKTASELNNDYFTIEKTVDNVNFEEVGQVQGHGTTTQPVNYSAVDRYPYNGVSYYRLKQTDFDGKFTYSDPVRVENTDRDVYLNVYPVPNDGHSVNVSISGLDAQISTGIKIIESSGRIVLEEELEVDPVTGVTREIHFTNQLVPGVYFMIIDLPEPEVRQILVQ